MNIEQKRFIQYFVLFIALLIFLMLFYYFRYNRAVLMIISAGGSIFYAFWGILHHALESRITRLIIFEYVFFAILVFLLLFTVLSF